MNVLFVTYDFPYPTNSGGKTRAYNLLKFAGKNANITLLSFVREHFEMHQKDALKQIGVEEVITFPRRSILDLRNMTSLIRNQSLFQTLYSEQEIERMIYETVQRKRIDVVQFESFYTAFYLTKKLREMGVKQVFGTENIEYRIYEGYAKYHPSSIMRRFFHSQAKKIKREEEAFYALADVCLAVTSGEKSYIDAHGGKKTVVIENGVDTRAFSRPKKRPESTLLFLGNFSYFPNVDGLRWFVEQVFSKLNHAISLTVVGRQSTKISFLKQPRIKTIEFVADLNDVYNLGNVFISPIRIGGGTNFKVLEAMAAKLPVIALSERVASLDFVDGKQLLIAEDSDSFAEKIAMLLRDKKLEKTIVENAYRSVKEQYIWAKI